MRHDGGDPVRWWGGLRKINVNVTPAPPPPNFFLALLPRVVEAVRAPQGGFLTPICTKTTHWGTILERIGPCLRVISEVKRRPTGEFLSDWFRMAWHGMAWHGMVDVCDGCLAAEASGSSFGQGQCH